MQTGRRFLVSFGHRAGNWLLVPVLPVRKATPPRDPTLRLLPTTNFKSLGMRITLLFLLAFSATATQRLRAEESAKPEVAAVPDVWVTSLASGTVTADSGPKQVMYAGTASGLLLQPADVVRWEGDDFAKRTTLMTHPVAVW